MRHGDTTRYGEGYHGTQQQGLQGGGEGAAPRGVDEIIICPIIVPSTSRGGFFHLTMQLHICAFNIRASRSHAYDAPESTPFSVQRGNKHRDELRDTTDLIGTSRRVALSFIRLKRKKGSSAIILPAYDVLGFVCHCDILSATRADK